MDTVILKLVRDHINMEEIERAGEVIKSGGLVAFPTETVYGLGGDALNPDSSRKIYEAKGRPSDNPLIVHIADFYALDRIADLEGEYPAAGIKDKVKKLADDFWPGPLTVILRKRPEVPHETTGGLDTVAIRMPSDEIAAALIRASGGYIAAPSANLSGRPSPTKVAHVIEDLSGRVDMILDGGDVDIGLESTIVDLTEERPMILRPGAITQDMLSKILGDIGIDPGLVSDESHTAPKAPGMKYRHYAPKGVLTIVTGAEDKVIDYINDRIADCKSDLIKSGVICPNEHVLRYRAPSVKCTGRLGDEEAVAHRLYAILREFDAEGVERIYSESFDPDGIGNAVMNRLIKAAGHNIVDAGR